MQKIGRIFSPLSSFSSFLLDEGSGVEGEIKIKNNVSEPVVSLEKVWSSGSGLLFGCYDGRAVGDSNIDLAKVPPRPLTPYLLYILRAP